MVQFSRMLAAAALLSVISSSMADVYMQSPLGCNDRNRERNENRNNGNRMCDTQNNAKGGVPWCGNREAMGPSDGFKFYAGSKLRIEWTAQHSAGANANVYSTVLLQYACKDPNMQDTSATTLYTTARNIRDGYPTGPLTDADPESPNQYYRATFISSNQNADGTNTIPCPSGIGCPGQNFNDGNLNTNSTLYNWFYNNNMTITSGTTTTTTTIPVEFGEHETFQYYRDMCLFTSRNKGLYTADQQLQGNTARFTRQNPNGGRSGFECPEERDYYPWWRPTPWKDIAIFVADLTWCAYFQTNSQNVKSRSYCSVSTMSAGNPAPISKSECESTGGSWKTIDSFGLSAPDCMLHAISRDNHLGNAVQIDTNGNLIAAYPQMAFYDWTIPSEAAGKQCVVRIRYNMSSSDYPQVNAFTTGTVSGTFWDFAKNCPATTATQSSTDVDSVSYSGDSYTQCGSTLNYSVNPVYNRPSVSVGATGYSKLAIAFNTNQVSRTFQDRSYVLKILSNPGCSGGGTIYNLNNRGRRGNIVQCYPAVENDFTPNRLSITTADCVHIQFCGSDFNPNNNPNNGEGWRYSTRHNILQNRARQSQFPLPVTTSSMFPDVAVATKMAYVGITSSTVCGDFQGDNSNNANNNITNCGKLNPAPAIFDGGLNSFSAGTYEYVSTRNNNFSNRSQKGILEVLSSIGQMTSAQKAGIAVGVIGTIAFIAGGVLFFVAKKNPHGKVAGFISGLKATTSQKNTVSL